MAARFQVLLTRVRHLSAGPLFRDERTCPELVLDAYAAETAQQAEALFKALCALGAVKSGRQRAKVIALSGSDTHRAAAWVASPVDLVPRWLSLAGAR